MSISNNKNKNKLKLSISNQDTNIIAESTNINKKELFTAKNNSNNLKSLYSNNINNTRNGFYCINKKANSIEMPLIYNNSPNYNTNSNERSLSILKNANITNNISKHNAPPILHNNINSLAINDNYKYKYDSNNLNKDKSNKSKLSKQDYQYNNAQEFNSKNTYLNNTNKKFNSTYSSITPKNNSKYNANVPNNFSNMEYSNNNNSLFNNKGYNSKTFNGNKTCYNKKNYKFNINNNYSNAVNNYHNTFNSNNSYKLNIYNNVSEFTPSTTKSKVISIMSLFASNLPIDIKYLTTNYQNFDSSKFSSKSLGVVKSYSANTHQGTVRDYNEDRVSIILNIVKPTSYTGSFWPKCSFFGVYDGHGGPGCAEFLRDNLHHFVIKNENFPVNPKEAIIQGFKKAEYEFISKYAFCEFNNCNDKSYNNFSNKNFYNNGNNVKDRSGSCAIVALIVDDLLYVANVGDSRAVLSKNKDVIPLSNDHKPDSPEETKRIEEAGGKIYQ